MSDLRLADLLVAISVATDMAMGHGPEVAVRSCLLATGLARELDVADDQVRDVYLTTLLRHLGCTATAADEATFFGEDELASRPAAERADFGDVGEMLRLTLSTARGAGWRRPGYVAKAFVGGKKISDRIFRAICEVAAQLAARLDLGAAVEEALYQTNERWDGKGLPAGVAGEDIVLPARIAEVATQATLAARDGGIDAALTTVRDRSGGWFDPSVVDAFVRRGPGLLSAVHAGDPWTDVLAAEPTPHLTVGRAGIVGVARTFADMTDLKSKYTLGHSAGVADLAARAARTMGLSAADTEALTIAGLLHDVGRVGVSARVWDKQGPLTASEWEAVRLHAYHTERILQRSAALAPLAALAGMHHERADASGYHRGAAGATLSTGARILAAADALQAMTQARPHRAALPPQEAADALMADVQAGLFDPDCARAVIEAAGSTPARVRSARPAGLSDREVEVLRLLASGLSNKQIAARLVISRRTAEHHVANIYGKIGRSTRAAAAVFAMEHDLIGPDPG